MTCFKTTLLAATALTMLTGAALADDNKAYIGQGSSSNEATITQTGSTNQAGLEDGDGGPIDQGMGAFGLGSFGSYNQLTITQTGDNNQVGTVGNQVSDGTGFQGAGVDQYGNASVATVTQTGGGSTAALGNKVGSILQQGLATGTTVGNTLTITQSSSGNNVDYAGQKYVPTSDVTAGNTATLTFSGSNNGKTGLDRASTDANSRNDGFFAGGPAANVSASVSVAGKTGANGTWQVGADNRIGLNVTGNDNRFAIKQLGTSNRAINLNIAGTSNALAISQDGANNLARVATIESGSDNNSIGVLQLGYYNRADLSITGSENYIGVRQNNTVNASTTRNNATMIVSGDLNGMYVDQDGSDNYSLYNVFGDSNYLNGVQTGFKNEIQVNIEGDNNNSVPNFTAGRITAKLGVTSAGSGFGTGGIIQDGNRNVVNLDVYTSDNRFGTYQKGNRNEVYGTIDGGTGNQAFVAQIGNRNLTGFTQNGSNNVLAVVQR